MHQCEQKQMNTDACRKELVCTKKEQGCTLARSYEQKAMDMCAHSKLQKSSEALPVGIVRSSGVHLRCVPGCTGK